MLLENYNQYSNVILRLNIKNNLNLISFLNLAKNWLSKSPFYKSKAKLTQTYNRLTTYIKILDHT